MIKSMTAYARASKRMSWGQLVLELHSVNRKGLDFSFYLPKELLRFDIPIRKWLSCVLERGQITVRINLQQEGEKEHLLSAYLPQLTALKKGWDGLAEMLGFDPQKEVHLPFLFSQIQSTSLCQSQEQEDEFGLALKSLVEETLDHLIEMKKEEGSALSRDLEHRLNLMEETLHFIEKTKENPLLRYRERLQEKLKELNEASSEMQERLLREVALLSEKIDITEELIRLHAHLEQFRKHLKTDARSIGKTLDFLAQEMHREVNTIGSKSIDNSISFTVVKLKSEIEKIREQVQNIE